jgi:hypothetical protein
MEQKDHQRGRLAFLQKLILHGIRQRLSGWRDKKETHHHGIVLLTADDHPKKDISLY